MAPEPEGTAAPARRAAEILSIVILLVALAPLGFPFWQADLPIAHDVGAHLTNLYRFDEALRQGQFPVRWVDGTSPGHNQPLFNYYQVGFYYLVEIVHLVVPRLSRALMLTVGLLWWTGAAFTFLLFRRLGVMPAAAAAATFALSPYLLVNAFVRAAYPEFAAIAFIPGMLWTLDRALTTGRSSYLAGFAVLASLVVVCHPPAALIASPLVAAYAAWLLWSSQTTVRRALRVVPAALLGAGLAAFYLVPAVLELNLVQVRRLTEGAADFRRHFVEPAQWVRFAWSYGWSFGNSVTDHADLMPMHISAVHWLCLAAAPVLVVVRASRAAWNRISSGLLLWLAITALAMFMMTRASLPVWEAVPPLAYVQFPWRYFLLLSISGAGLAALTVASTPRRLQIGIVVLVVGLQIHFYHRRLAPQGYLPQDELQIDDRDWRHTADARHRGFYEYGYDPVDASPPPQGLLGRWTVVEGHGTVTARSAAVHALVLDAYSDGPTVVRINSRTFPGWSVRLDGSSVPLASDEHGYLVVSLPAGHHSVEARFGNTPVRTTGNAISLISVILLGALVARRSAGIGSGA